MQHRKKGSIEIPPLIKQNTMKKVNLLDLKCQLLRS